MFLISMPFEHGFKFGVSLGVGICSMLGTSVALAAPAPVFSSVLEEISPSATTVHPVRLPTTVPSDIELHPSIFQDPLPDGLFMLRLDTEPDCSAIDCVAMGIVITAESPNWPPEDKQLTAVELGNGIQGYEVVSSVGGLGFGSVQWTQDESLYALSYKLDIFTTEDAIAMAASMASEPPFATSQLPSPKPHL